MLKVMGETLRHLHAHDALLLLCYVSAIPKLLYILRTSPCIASPEFDLRPSLAISPMFTLVNRILRGPRLPSLLGMEAWVSGLHPPSAFLVSATASLDLSTRCSQTACAASRTKPGMKPWLCESRTQTLHLLQSLLPTTRGTGISLKSMRRPRLSMQTPAHAS